MCGIICYISAGSPCSEPTPDLIELLKARGPDYTGSIRITLKSLDIVLDTSSEKQEESGQNDTYISCHASVLSLRGSEVTSQPIQQASSLSGRHGHVKSPILCWNGEVFGYQGKQLGNSSSETNGDATAQTSLTYGQSDTAWIYENLHEASRIEFERRKANITGNDQLSAKSAVCRVIDKIQGPFAFVFVDTFNERLYYGRDRLGRRSLLTKRINDNEICIASVSDGTEGWKEVAPEERHILDLDDNRSICNHLMPSSQNGAAEENNDPNKPSETPHFNQNLPKAAPQPMSVRSASVAILQSLLEAALDVRLNSLPTSNDHQQPRTAVLFSGGLDCSTLARMMHDILPHNEPIDLLNVAFENPRISNNLTAEESYSQCPDRITALATYAELIEVCPERLWRLVKIDVPYTETLAHRPTIKKLMYPHATEMDLSIASALYFAARGQGYLHSSSQPEEMPFRNRPYRTPARVLISGLGADELFAGYQRHATAFSRGGHAALLAELKLDYERLGTRNLGRDDRVLSHWGRECRFPFLDERVVQWAVAAPVGDKCGFGAAATDEAPDAGGHGEQLDGEEAQKRQTQRDEIKQAQDIEPGKKALRLVAERLGMHLVAREKKRAIQFGARSAKMESGRSRGTDML